MWLSHPSYEIICVGSVSKDIFFPTDEGTILETPEDITAKQKVAFELGGKYRVADRYEAVGGVAANVACGLARLNRKVAVFSCIGDDEVGRYITNELKKETVATELLCRYPDAQTDLSAIVVLTQNGERTIFHNRDANERLVVEPQKLAHAQWVFVSALNGDWKTNVATLLDARQKLGFSLAYNPGQHNIKDDARQVLHILKQVDVLLLNKDEAIELTMQSEPCPADAELNEEAFLLKRLFTAGAKVIGMTDGKRGAWGYDGTTLWHCPIYTRNGVVDSTGAGDAFGSGFFAAHVMGLSLSECLRYGIANSGSVIGYYGAIAGLLKTGEMKEIVQHVTPQPLTEL